MRDGSKVLTGVIIQLSVTPRGGQNTVIGQAMSMDVAEQYALRPVFGIGNLTAQEIPILGYSGQVNMNQYAIDKNATQTLMNQFARKGTTEVPDLAAWTKQILFTEGVDITVARKAKVNGAMVTETVAKISGAMCQHESMSMSENQLVMRSGSFMFPEPISV